MPRRNKSIKHVQSPIVSCSPKRQFDKEKIAKEAAEYQMLIKPSLELSVYQCNICNKWHLTRQPRNNNS